MQFSLYRYVLFLADFARHKFPEEIDSYADYYYWDIEIADLKQVQYLVLYAVYLYPFITTK
jgi:hypothetical protein